MEREREKITFHTTGGVWRKKHFRTTNCEMCRSIALNVEHLLALSPREFDSLEGTTPD